ncbi:MAG: hypothetical protein IKJ18_04890 [Bacteroidaceae bacterium]|nr:hypothetical protein [Bacteroidaceae bacterium]
MSLFPHHLIVPQPRTVQEIGYPGVIVETIHAIHELNRPRHSVQVIHGIEHRLAFTPVGGRSTRQVHNGFLELLPVHNYSILTNQTDLPSSRSKEEHCCEGQYPVEK